MRWFGALSELPRINWCYCVQLGCRHANSLASLSQLPYGHVLVTVNCALLSLSCSGMHHDERARHLQHAPLLCVHARVRLHTVHKHSIACASTPKMLIAVLTTHTGCSLPRDRYLASLNTDGQVAEDPGLLLAPTLPTQQPPSGTATASSTAGHAQPAAGAPTRESASSGASGSTLAAFLDQVRSVVAGWSGTTPLFKPDTAAVHPALGSGLPPGCGPGQQGPVGQVMGGSGAVDRAAACAQWVAAGQQGAVSASTATQPSPTSTTAAHMAGRTHSTAGHPGGLGLIAAQVAAIKEAKPQVMNTADTKALQPPSQDNFCSQWAARLPEGAAALSWRELLTGAGVRVGDYVSVQIMQHCDAGSLWGAVRGGAFCATRCGPHPPVSEREARRRQRSLVRTAREVAEVGVGRND